MLWHTHTIMQAHAMHRPTGRRAATSALPKRYTLLPLHRRDSPNSGRVVFCERTVHETPGNAGLSRSSRLHTHTQDSCHVRVIGNAACVYQLSPVVSLTPKQHNLMSSRSILQTGLSTGRIDQNTAIYIHVTRQLIKATVPRRCGRSQNICCWW